MTDRIDIEDGKYTIVGMESGWLRALRYGEEWRVLTGDNLVLCMAQEIERLRGENGWEYGVLEPNGDLMYVAISLESATHGGFGPVVRRRKAGPWERVEGEDDA